MNWKTLDPQSLRNLARDRFGEALKIDQLTDEEIAVEMDTYDQMKGGTLETQKAKRPDEPKLHRQKPTSLNTQVKRRR